MPSVTCAAWLGLVSLAGAQTSPPPDGNRLIADAARAVATQPSLEAKVRQRASLFGQQLTGAGFFSQMRDGDRVLVRYEFKLQLAHDSLALLQINDGSTLWLRRDKGEAQVQSYVNLRRLQEAREKVAGRAALEESLLSDRARPDRALDDGALTDLALGGLVQMLNSLSHNFDFASPRATELKGIPMWELDGQWKPDRLQQLLPGQTAAIQAGRPADTRHLADHLPDAVHLMLGRDENFPLFPYRIEYARLKRAAGLASIAPLAFSATGPLVTLEFFEVRRRPDLTPADFAYQPGNQDVEDLTDAYIRKLENWPVR